MTHPTDPMDPIDPIDPTDPIDRAPSDASPSDPGFDPDDPVAAAWARQADADPPPGLSHDPATLADSVAHAHRQDQRRLLWLNVQEVVPAVALTAWFGAAAAGSARPLATLAAGALVAGVGGFLAVNSLRHRRADQGWGASVRDQLARRLDQVRHRAHLYRTVAWWYLAPLAAALALARYGAGGSLDTGDGLYLVSAVGLFALIYLLNRRVGLTRYQPEVDRLQALLADLDHPTQP